MKPDAAKLRELILYIAARCEGDPGFAKVKLFKILFYADFTAYAETGEAITGCAYKKFPHGPVPDGGMEMLDQLEGQDIAVARRHYFGREQLQPKALRDADLSAFNGAQIAIVDRVITELWGMNAKDVSDLSHRFIGWKAALPYEVIPYETVLVDAGPATEEEERWLEGLVKAGR